MEIRSNTCATAVAVACALVLAPGAAAKGHHTVFSRTNLVADQAGRARLVDANLVNAWGLSAGPSTPLWVSNEGTETSTVYSGLVGGAPFGIVPLVVGVAGGPTGTVFNGSAGFGGAPFLFATEAGTIMSWTGGTTATVAATTPGAIYTGLALASDSRGSFLYAANMASGAVDVFDSSFAPVVRPGAFHDRKLPRGYAPFNVQELGGSLYVAYAKADPVTHDEVKGPGRGVVDVFDTRGKLLRRLARHGTLNAPWGLAMAPRGFGGLGGAILVGNFGDGRIHAFSRTGRLLGTLRTARGSAVRIDGLWGLRFGNGVYGTPHDLFFSAGPKDEKHGLLGVLDAVVRPGGWHH